MKVSELSDTTEITGPRMSLAPLHAVVQEVIDDLGNAYERVKKSLYVAPRQHVDLKLFIQTCLASLGTDRLTVRVHDYDSATAQALLPFVADCDKISLKVAFLELLENSLIAVQVSGKERKDARITVELRLVPEERSGKTMIQIDYRDNGCGITQRDLNRIFSQNVTLWPKSVKQGNGMGLHVVQSAVVPYGGSVWAKECADGAWFVIQLAASSLPLDEQSVADSCQDNSMEFNW